jgi:hypothetical protein
MSTSTRPGGTRPTSGRCSGWFPRSRIIYLSDIPFTSPAGAVITTGGLAIEAGLSATQVRAVMGAQLERLVSHDEPIELGPAPREVTGLAPELERLYVTLLTAAEPMLRGADPGQGLQLAQAAADCPVGSHAEVIRWIAALLELNERKIDRTPCGQRADHPESTSCR